ncbi:MAG TPA: glutathione S-transferase family protein [Sphingomicrobium sp.]|jgi:glutathione S-transferase|nr:glutathione S-transferase family protein [Sphingomicrobium sp.]
MKIIGSYVSPYVRKVLVCMELKGLEYEVDPITPFFGNDEFRRLSPLCRIPVLIDNGLVLTDSTVIAQYLDEQFPEPPLLPSEPKERARARWLEEFADTRLGDVFIWGLFYPKMVHPRVWNEPGDQSRIDRTLSTELPKALDYLEGELPVSGYLFGDIGLADIAIASFFRNGSYAGFVPDEGRWPKTSAFVELVLRHPAFQRLHQLEMIQLSTTIEGRRQALLDAGAKLTEETYGQREPRKGIMQL